MSVKFKPMNRQGVDKKIKKEATIMKKFIIPSIVTLATVAPALACFFVIKKRG